MAGDIYPAIKTAFEAAAGLDGLGDLYLGKGPDPEEKSKPYCVMMTGEETEVTQCFGLTIREESVVFTVVADEFDDLEAWVDALDAVFADTPTAISPGGGINVMDIRKSGTAYEKHEFAFEAAVSYVFEYSHTR
jgi:hypothetical protein